MFANIMGTAITNKDLAIEPLSILSLFMDRNLFEMVYKTLDVWYFLVLSSLKTKNLIISNASIITEVD